MSSSLPASPRGPVVALLVGLGAAYLPSASLTAAQDPLPRAAVAIDPLLAEEETAGRSIEAGRYRGSRSWAPDSTPFLPESGPALTEVPAREIAFGRELPPTHAHHPRASAFGLPDGQVAVVYLEEFTLQSRFSTDEGTSFSGERTITSGPSGLGVLDFVATAAGDGRIYVAYQVADPDGDIGVQVVVSDDHARTWRSPVDLVRTGDTLDGAIVGLGTIAIDANDSGRVTIGCHAGSYEPILVMTSSDAGLTWTDPVRVDTGTQSSSAPFYYASIDVAVDDAGVVHIAYKQYRGSTTFIWHRRSTDGGQTFGTEQNIGSLAHPGVTRGARYVDLEVAADDSLLLAMTESRYLTLMRSADHGVTFTRSSETTYTASISFPQVVASESDSTVLVSTAHRTSSATWYYTLHVQRSTDHGATLGTPTMISTSARYGPHSAIRRTAAGNFAIAWTDGRADHYAALVEDLFVRTSTDGGASWGPEQRVESDPPGSAASMLDRAAVAATGFDTLVLAFRDRRETSGRSDDLWLARSPAASPAFGADALLDDERTPSPPLHITPAVATDGAQRLYVAYAADEVGPFTSLLLRTSDDSGYSFRAPRRIGSAPAGDRISNLPVLRAQAGGGLDLVYQSWPPSGPGPEIRFNRSTDGGASWMAQDAVLGLGDPYCGPSYYCWFSETGDVQVARSDASKVSVAWSDADNIYLARSFDGGMTFETIDIDGGLSATNYSPALCANGNKLALAFLAMNSSSRMSVYARTSTDGGATWTAPTALQSDSGADGGFLVRSACDGVGTAVVTWMDRRGGTYTYARVFVSRWDGTAWSTDSPIAGGWEPAENPKVVYAGLATFIVTYESADGALYQYSSDGGRTFLSGPYLSDSSGDLVSGLEAVADRLGSVWFTWEDSSRGWPSIAIRRARSFGAVLDPLYRLDRWSPPGGRYNWFDTPRAPTAALPGTAFVAWCGQRGSQLDDLLVNAYDTDDFDRDRRVATEDCLDTDPDSWAIPDEVAALAVTREAAVIRVAWASQGLESGSRTAYDLVTGDVGQLLAGSSYAEATCLASAWSDSTFEDAGPIPAPASAGYYLARARNACGLASYGDSSLGMDPRDALDADGPCP